MPVAPTVGTAKPKRRGFEPLPKGRPVMVFAGQMLFILPVFFEGQRPRFRIDVVGVVMGTADGLPVVC
jgi:hypothetical protein